MGSENFAEMLGALERRAEWQADGVRDEAFIFLLDP